MPTIVYQTNPTTGAKYAYESISYWDKDKKAPRSKRRYLGRVDPETGEIIKGSRKRKEEAPAAGEDGGGEVPQLLARLDEKDAEIASLREKLGQMTARYEEAAALLARIHAASRPFGDKT